MNFQYEQDEAKFRLKIKRRLKSLGVELSDKGKSWTTNELIELAHDVLKKKRQELDEIEKYLNFKELKGGRKNGH